jgi:CO/xanthine dehydrogenase FAD-binding subunit
MRFLPRARLCMSSPAFAPASLAQALRILAEHSAVPVAGGTDLMVRHRRHGPLVVDLGGPALLIGGLDGLKGISSAGERVVIGAATTLSELGAHPDTHPGLLRALSEFASPAIRNAGTIGGNICNASPAADTLPVLYAVDASVVLASCDGERTLAIDKFIVGPGQTALDPAELLVRVLMPRRAPGFIYYRKVAPRRSNALSKLAVYAQAEAARDGTPRVASLSLALGAVAPMVVRNREAESMATGLSAKELRSRAEELADLYRNTIRPIDDQRSTANYRKNTSLALLRHLFSEELPRFLECP